MKWVVFVVLFLCPGTLWALSVDMGYQMLEVQIAKLSAERDELQKQLDDCLAKKKGLKIAGITTLATTGVGLYANVKLNEKIRGMKSGDAASGMPKDTRNETQKNCDSCAMFIRAGIKPLPDECTGC